MSFIESIAETIETIEPCTNKTCTGLDNGIHKGLIVFYNDGIYKVSYYKDGQLIGNLLTTIEYDTMLVYVNYIYSLIVARVL